jgi:cation diffusion facilitator family transporter
MDRTHGTAHAHRDSLDRWRHDHSFGQEQRRPGEVRTLWVIALTAVTMVIEIAAGIAFGSMALLADGLHMASHAIALGVSATAYVYARWRATDPRFSFGTGKVNALGGFTGALLLAVFSLAMVVESGQRLLAPIPIAYDLAIVVAVVGLVVNGLSVLILGGHQEHGDGHHHDDGHHHHDHNLRSAYLHVLADALTSVLAILALLAGKHAGMAWLDPVIGVLGAALIARWAYGLLRDTSGILLDHQAPGELLETIRASIEAHGADRVADLHLWRVGPGLHAAEIVVLTHDPITPGCVKARLPDTPAIVHATVEIHRCCVDDPAASR